MKKIIVLLMTIAVLTAVLAGCAGNKDTTTTAAPAESTQTTAKSTGSESAKGDMPTLLNATEYTLYQNIFFNDMAGDYVDKSVTKEGTFAILYDAFNDVTRYYVWGYYDETKCCDWQWELKVEDTSNLPSPGSLIKVTGTFVNDDSALDKYWIIDPEITVETAYEGPDCDIDITTMDGTLLRVEFQNIQMKKEQFEGKTVAAYGRINGPHSVQHPYYDNACELSFVTDETVPDFGKMVIVEGIIADGAITEATFTETDQY